MVENIFLSSGIILVFVAFHKVMMATTNHDEQALIRRAAAGDEVAMADLFAPYQNPVFSYIYRWIDHWQTAEDLAHEALFKAMDVSRDFASALEGRPSLSSWAGMIITTNS